MMFCMPRGIDRRKPQLSNLDYFCILCDDELTLGNWQEITPQRLHSISVDTRRAGEQFLGVNHMRRTNGMHINLRALLSQPSRRAGMIEMDMRQQNMSHISGR